MFVRIVAFAVVFATGATLALAFSSGPPASRTGAPAVGARPAEGLCTACHVTFAPNLPGATLQLLDVPVTFSPDSAYVLRVRMTSTFTPTGVGRRWGFELTAVNAATGDSAGSFAPLDNTTQTLAGAGAFAARHYIEHTTVGTRQGNNGPVEWSVRWKAPGDTTSRVLFFAAGNASDNSATNSGDHIYTTRDTCDRAVTVGAPPTVLAGAVLSAGPNPFGHSTTLRFRLGAPARVALDVLDPQGRLVRRLARGPLDAGAHALVWDGRSEEGSAAPAGVYFARLSAPGLASRSVRITLHR